MSRQRASDPLPHLHAVAEALAVPGQPEAVFRALDRALAAVLGHKLFTLLLHHPDTGESERRYTSRPEAYPVGGRKPLNPTPWAQRVLRDHQPYLGRTAEDIRAVFFDHELIASLGCASVLNLPVVYDGQILGTVNLLHEERWYEEGDIPVGLTFAALVVPAYLQLTGQLTGPGPSRTTRCRCSADDRQAQRVEGLVEREAGRVVEQCRDDHEGDRVAERQTS